MASRMVRSGFVVCDQSRTAAVRLLVRARLLPKVLWRLYPAAVVCLCAASTQRAPREHLVAFASPDCGPRCLDEYTHADVGAFSSLLVRITLVAAIVGRAVVFALQRHQSDLGLVACTSLAQSLDVCHATPE